MITRPKPSLRFIILCLPALLLGSFGAAQGGVEEASLPPLVHVPPTTHAPQIDGVIAPGEWDGAFMSSGTTQISQGGLDPIKVQYWFTYDATNIYVAGRMQINPGENYATLPRKLGGGGPAGHFEFLIDPNSCHPDKNWVQAMLYPLGKYQNVGYSQRIGGFVPYEVEWTYKDSAKDGWWTVELTAPADALNRATTKDGQTWGILLGGAIWNAMGYFSGTTGDPYNMRSRYMKLMFDKTAPVIQIADMGDISTGTITPKIVVRNTTGKELPLKVDFSLRSSILTNAVVLQSESKSATVAAGQQGEYTWSVPTPGTGTNTWLFMTVTSADKPLYGGIYKLAAPRSPLFAGEVVVDKEPVIFESYLYPYFNKLKAIADFGGVADPGAVKEARFKVTVATGKDIATATTKQFDNRAVEQIIALPDKLAEGTYTVTVDILGADGKSIMSKTDTFTKKVYPFEHNTLGVSTKVLYPWTPIKVNDGKKTVDVWNRTYTLGADGLPQRIVTAGEQVLAAPIALVETVNGKASALKGTGLRFTETADHQIQAVAGAKGRTLSAEIKLLGEYDGMLKYEVTLTGEKDATIDGLDLVMPVNEKHGKFLHAAGDGCRSNYSHLLPDGKGKVWNSTAVMNWVIPTTWLPYVWLGDEERGLCWWADSAEGWTLPKDKKTPVVEISRRNGQAVAVFHIINRKTHVLWKNESPRKLIFAFEATPMKPRPSWARDVGCFEGTKQKGPLIQWFGSTGWAFVGREKEGYANYSYAYLRPIDSKAEEELKRICETYKTQGREVLAYTDMMVRSLVGDMEKAFAWEWNPKESDQRKAAVLNAPQFNGATISTTPSRIDYDIWCLNHNMDLGIKYWYFDEIQTEGQLNPVTGLGYQDEDGKWMPTTKLFGYRQLWKRLYTLMQERGQQEPLIVIHNTSTTYAGPMAFCTATFDFEQANSDPNARQLTMFGIDYLQTESMGHQYGFVGTTLGPARNFESWVKTDQEMAEAARHWAGVHMLLDMTPYLHIPPQVVDGLKMLGEFGWNQPDCRWIPFWEAKEKSLYTVSPAGRVYVSAYKRGRRALLIMLNDTNEAITLNWQPSNKFGAAGPLIDAHRAGVTINAEKGAYRVTIPRYDYRAMFIETNGDY